MRGWGWGWGWDRFGRESKVVCTCTERQAIRLASPNITFTTVPHHGEALANMCAYKENAKMAYGSMRHGTMQMFPTVNV